MKKETIEQFEKETGWHIVKTIYASPEYRKSPGYQLKTKEEYLSDLSEWLEKKLEKAYFVMELERNVRMFPK